MSKSRGKNRNPKERKQIASRAMSFLSNILNKNNSTNPILYDSVAKSMLSLGKRHGIRPKLNLYPGICRTCHSSLIPGKSSRVRISNGFVLNTCITCQRIYRFRLDRKGGKKNDENPKLYN